MPGFNRTGPKGEGVLTGKGRGKCNTKKSGPKEQLITEDSPQRERRRKQINASTKEGKRFGRGKGWNR